MPMIGDATNNLAAVSLIRAAVTDDADAGVLIMAEHSALEDRELSRFVMALAGVAARSLLTVNGYNIERTIKTLETWAAEYDDDAETAR
jgi:hypothetical protein